MSPFLLAALTLSSPPLAQTSFDKVRLPLDATKLMSVHYLPFRVSTGGAMSIELISKRPSELSLFNAPQRERFVRFLSGVRSPDEGFSAALTRLVLIFRGGAIYSVDQAGNVRYDDGKTKRDFVLTAPTFTKVESFLTILKNGSEPPID